LEEDVGQDFHLIIDSSNLHQCLKLHLIVMKGLKLEQWLKQKEQ
jgi:hypothetical protein